MDDCTVSTLEHTNQQWDGSGESDSGSLSLTPWIDSEKKKIIVYSCVAIGDSKRVPPVDTPNQWPELVLIN